MNRIENAYFIFMLVCPRDRLASWLRDSDSRWRVTGLSHPRLERHRLWEPS